MKIRRNHQKPLLILSMCLLVGAVAALDHLMPRRHQGLAAAIERELKD
jgi:hypothetical protein